LSLFFSQTFGLRKADNIMAAQTESGFAATRAAASADDVERLVPEYQKMLTGMREIFNSGRTKNLKWREQQLERVLDMVEDCHEDITAAVRADLGGPKLRGIAECNPHTSAQEALNHLKEWSAPETVYTPFQVSPTRLGKSTIRKEPKGVVLIISPWNYPIELAIHPIVAAVAAGNCVVLKPSEISAASAACLEKLINKYLDNECVKVVQGRVSETQALLKLQWDHIFFTGSGDVGRKVMAAAAVHLTPVTLELGGKSPVIIDKSAKVDMAVERVSMAKWFNVGQTCIAPDYILVADELKQPFIDGLKKRLKQYYGENPKDSADWGKIINSRHTQRIVGLIRSDPSAKVITGGADESNEEACYIPPTVMETSNFDSALLKEEIFGPVLPVIGVSSTDEAIKRVNSVCDRPLALYCFSENQKVTDKVLGSTLSGGACVNTVMDHVLNHELPFGGIGGSGVGAYHGKAGFDEFTHRRACFQQDSLLKKDASLPPPPYKDGLYDILVKVLVKGFIPRKYRPAVATVLKLTALICFAVAVKRFMQ